MASYFSIPQSIAFRDDSSTYCTNGTDGYPSLVEFNAKMENYVNRKRRTERTAISQADSERIQYLLSNPDALRSEPSASYKTWIKKTFCLKPTLAGTIVCRKEKDPQDARPIATKEMMYFVLKHAHAGEGHGGRDKTAKIVKQSHSFVRKGLICLFLELCPTCRTRTEALKKEKLNNVQTAPKFSNNIFNLAARSPVLPQAVAYPVINQRYSMPSIFTQPIVPDNQVSTYPSFQNHEMSLALAQVPAAPLTSYGVPPQSSAALYDLPDSSILTNLLMEPYLMTPNTACSFGDFQLQNQQPYHHASLPEANFNGNLRPVPRDYNRITSTQPSEPIKFSNPFEMSSMPLKSHDFQPSVGQSFPQVDASAPFLDLFGHLTPNSIYSPMSQTPPPQMASQDLQHIDNFLFPTTNTKVGRFNNRHSCF
ncbi:uncharacterized protein MELLADRAFT_84584 [Melampsora larici-populina 98AG31]|uniref:Integrase zinc-binding domain-containing protein n=1 Tax=Melampsora larici-populina (strain 98AG31 / pathotype 3-4-7) TaxID=747676 RepID=F4RFW7_MELLP|nr:uncharacterized protein MELLADRAFT_84584 [Melampsora larici-populina 98AG31]EGG08423.1 hypothetical protein MELLADRAFT_84584 [Melampsora larici-populina 98AG31]